MERASCTLFSNGVPRDIIGKRNPCLLVQDDIRMKMCGKALPRLGCIIVNGVPREVPHPKPFGPATPWMLALGLP